MGLLTAMRRLIDGLESTGSFMQGAGDHRRCRFCQGNRWDHTAKALTGHAPDCPLLSLPKIVATLEAAEAVVSEYAVKSDERFGPIARLKKALEA